MAATNSASASASAYSAAGEGIAAGINAWTAYRHSKRAAEIQKRLAQIAEAQAKFQKESMIAAALSFSALLATESAAAILDAQRAEEIAEARGKEVREVGKRQRGTFRARLSTAGVVSGTGSPLLVLAEQAYQTEKLANIEEFEAVNVAKNLRQKAANAKWRGIQTVAAANRASAGTLLAGDIQAAMFRQQAAFQQQQGINSLLGLFRQAGPLIAGFLPTETEQKFPFSPDTGQEPLQGLTIGGDL
jgi:hypothetical protein